LKLDVGPLHIAVHVCPKVWKVGLPYPYQYFFMRAYGVLTFASNLINRSFLFRSRPVIRTFRNGCCVDDWVLFTTGAGVFA
jgi:hypothetical protein